MEAWTDINGCMPLSPTEAVATLIQCEVSRASSSADIAATKPCSEIVLHACHGMTQGNWRVPVAW